MLARNDDLRARDAVHPRGVPAGVDARPRLRSHLPRGVLPAGVPRRGLFPVFKKAADNWTPSALGRVFSFEPGSTAIPDTDPMTLPAEVTTVVMYDADYLPYWPREVLPLVPLSLRPGQAAAGRAPAGAGVPDVRLPEDPIRSGRERTVRDNQGGGIGYREIVADGSKAIMGAVETAAGEGGGEAAGA
jgi:hypothetical protein